ncbi:Protein Y37D8A.16, partial [Aphelenchoides avenae]
PYNHRPDPARPSLRDRVHLRELRDRPHLHHRLVDAALLHRQRRHVRADVPQLRRRGPLQSHERLLG